MNSSGFALNMEFTITDARIKAVQATSLVVGLVVIWGCAITYMLSSHWVDLNFENMTPFLAVASIGTIIWGIITLWLLPEMAEVSVSVDDNLLKIKRSLIGHVVVPFADIRKVVRSAGTHGLTTVIRLSTKQEYLVFTSLTEMDTVFHGLDNAYSSCIFLSMPVSPLP